MGAGQSSAQLSVRANGPCVAAHLVPAAGVLITVSTHCIEYWSLTDGQRNALIFSPHSRRPFLAATYHAKLDRLLVGDEGGCIYVFRASSGRLLASLPRDGKFKEIAAITQGSRAAVTALAVLPDGTFLAGSEDASVRLWNKTEPVRAFHPSAAPVSVPSTMTASVSAIVYEPSAGSIVVGYVDGLVRIFGDQGSLVAECAGHTGTVFELCLVQDQLIFISASKDSTLRAWQLPTGKLLCQHSIDVTCMWFDPQRDLLVTGGSTGIISHLRLAVDANTAEIRLLSRSEGHKSGISCISFNSEEDALVSADMSTHVKVWTDVTKVNHEAASRPRSTSLAEKFIIGERHASEILSSLNDEEAVPRLTLMRVQRERELLDLYMQMMARDLSSQAAGAPGPRPRRDTMDSRRAQLEREFNKLEEDLTRVLDETREDMIRQRQRLARKHRNIVDAESAEAEMHDHYEHRLAQMKKRHEAELAFLKEQFEDEVRNYHFDLPRLRRQTAGQVVDLDDDYLRQTQDLEQKYAEQMRRLLLSSTFFGYVVGDRFLFGRRITQDSRSTFLAIDLDNAQLCAVHQTGMRNYNAVIDKVNQIRGLSHRNLAPIVDVCTSDKNMYIAVPHYEQNLEQYVHAQGTIPPARAAKIVHRLLHCIHFLTTAGVVHRDVRPKSIFVDEDGSPILYHLGMIKPRPLRAGRCYAAPEIVLDNRIVPDGPGADIWSIGCLLVYLLQTPAEREASPVVSGPDVAGVFDRMHALLARPPLGPFVTAVSALGRPRDEFFSVIRGTEQRINAANIAPSLQSQIKSLCAAASDQALDLIGKMLELVPASRIGPVDAAKHSFFAETLEEQSSEAPPTSPVVAIGPVPLQRLNSVDPTDEGSSLESSPRNL